MDNLCDDAKYKGTSTSTFFVLAAVMHDGTVRNPVWDDDNLWPYLYGRILARASLILRVLVEQRSPASTTIHPKIMGTYAIGRVKVNSRN